MEKPYEMLLVGVGGQGILTIFKILGNAANELDLACVGAETHGMSQRGGSVYVHLRIGGKESTAPLVLEGNADLVVALEPAEALRFARYVHPERGTILTSSNIIEPSTLTLTRSDYPNVDAILDALHQYTPTTYAADFRTPLESEKGTGVRSLNIAMLGAMSSLEGFPIPTDVLQQAIQDRYPKYWGSNKKAFDIGVEQFQSLLSA